MSLFESVAGKKQSKKGHILAFCKSDRDAWFGNIITPSDPTSNMSRRNTYFPSAVIGKRTVEDTPYTKGALQ
jgi:hypothetical protein